VIARKITDTVPMFLPPPETPRSVGLHASALIRCIATEAGILSPDGADELSLSDVRIVTDPVAILRMSIGLAWEAYYIPKILSHHGVSDHPGELHVDGIYMSPDGESVSTVMITLTKAGLMQVVHEVKATYKSTKTVGEDLSNPENWMWITQLKTYCKGLGTRFAQLHVLFLCGDYKFPITPKREVWEIEFTEAEIEDNWSLLTEYRDHRRIKDAQ
jgi:hypothetical protein